MGDDSFDVQTIDVGDIVPPTTKVNAKLENILQSDFRTSDLNPNSLHTSNASVRSGFCRHVINNIAASCFLLELRKFSPPFNDTLKTYFREAI